MTGAVPGECGPTLAAGCPRCGSRIERAQCSHSTCPSGGGCAVASCPACGLVLPDPRRARLAHLLSRWLYRDKR